MSRFQILVVLVALSARPAAATCRIRATGQLRFTGTQPSLIAFAGSLGEVRLNISAAPGTDQSELSLHLLALRDRTVVITGTCTHPPRDRGGDILTDLGGVRLTLPNALKPNNGDEVEVDPG